MAGSIRGRRLRAIKGGARHARAAFDKRLPIFDDIRGELRRVAAADVLRRVDRSSRDEQDLAGLERHRRLALELILQRSFDDVDDLFARMALSERRLEELRLLLPAVIHAHAREGTHCLRMMCGGPRVQSNNLIKHARVGCQRLCSALSQPRTPSTVKSPSERAAQRRNERACNARQHSRQRERALNLVAARRAVKAPLAEVLAVVSEQAVAVLPNTRAGALDHFRSIEQQTLMEPHPDWASMSEACKRNFFHRLPNELMCEGAVLHDSVPAHVDAVVRITKTRCNEVRAQRRLLAPCQLMVASKSTATPLPASCRKMRIAFPFVPVCTWATGSPQTMSAGFSQVDCRIVEHHAPGRISGSCSSQTQKAFSSAVCAVI